MKKNSIRTMILPTMLVAGLTWMGGCQDDAQTGALVGAGGGALLGQAIGGNTKSTLIGAGAGAGAGYIIGNEMDKKKAREDREDLQRQLDRERRRNRELERENRDD